MDRPISFKEWRATIVLFLLPILIVGLSSIDVIQQRHERVQYKKILEQKPQDYFIYKSDAISVEQVKKKADGKL